MPAGNSGRLELLATDDAERFARVGGIFLGRPLKAGDVEIVDRTLFVHEWYGEWRYHSLLYDLATGRSIGPVGGSGATP